MHEYKWAPDLPYMDVRRFIAERLRCEPPSHELDIKTCEFLNVPLVACTQDLAAAVSIIPEGWWWHLSHLEAKVTPTRSVPGAPISNSKIYDFYGKPVGFSGICWERKELPAALCEALLKARYDLPVAFVAEASATAHNDFRSRMESYKERRRPKPSFRWRVKDRLYSIYSFIDKFI